MRGLIHSLHKEDDRDAGEARSRKTKLSQQSRRNLGASASDSRVDRSLCRWCLLLVSHQNRMGCRSPLFLIRFRPKPGTLITVGEMDTDASTIGEVDIG